MVSVLLNMSDAFDASAQPERYEQWRRQGCTQSVTPELGLVRTKGSPVLVLDFGDCGKWNGKTIAGTGMSVIKVTTEPRGADETSFRLEHSCTAKFTGKNLFGDTTREETYQCASRGPQSDAKRPSG